MAHRLQVVTVEDLYEYKSRELSEFLCPEALAFRAVRSRLGSDAIVLGPHFITSPLDDHVMMSPTQIETACRLLARHPDIRAWCVVWRQLQYQYHLPSILQNHIADFLELAENLKERLAAMVDVDTSLSFVFRAAAAFAGACGLPDFPHEVLATACGRLPGGDLSSVLRNTSQEDQSLLRGTWRKLLLDRISAVYWLDAQSLGANGFFIISGIFGRTQGGHWFFYKDLNPSATHPCHPKMFDTGLQFFGGHFHRKYIARASTDLHQLLSTLDRRDVGQMIGNPALSSVIVTRADVLLRLHLAMDSVAKNIDRLTPEELELQRLDLLEALRRALSTLDSASRSLSKEQRPDEMLCYGKEPLQKISDKLLAFTTHLVANGAQPSSLSEARELLKYDFHWPPKRSCGVEICMASLLNELQVFHSKPIDPIDVPISELRYTQCSISAEFGKGGHAGMHLNSLVDSLHSGEVRWWHKPMVLNAVRHRGRLFSLNNRRLWCLREYYRRCPSDQYRFVKVLIWPLARGVQFEGEEICEKFCRSLTTTTDGFSIRIASVVD